MDFIAVVAFAGSVISLVSVSVIIVMNYYKLRKMRGELALEKRNQQNEEVCLYLEQSKFGVRLISKLDKISENQEISNEALVHMLRSDLMKMTDEIMYVHRKRNTKGSKWYAVGKRLAKFNEIEEVMDGCFKSYVSLGGNHNMEIRYQDCKQIISETRKAAEDND